MIHLTLQFVRSHISLILIVTGGFFALVLPFLVVPLIGILILERDRFWSSPWVGQMVRTSIPAGAVLLIECTMPFTRPEVRLTPPGGLRHPARLHFFSAYALSVDCSLRRGVLFSAAGAQLTSLM